MKKIVSVIICIMILLSFGSLSVSAAPMIPYLGYEYNKEEESVPAPIGYEPIASVFGNDIDGDIGALSAPADMCLYNEELYILDSGNSRIIVTDSELKLRRVIGGITLGGEVLNYKDAKGLYVCHDGNILIADTANQRIIECDNSGNGIKLFTKPETPMLSSELVYSVKKVIRDYNGITYALVDGVNDGAITYMADGSFGGFFAMNEVEKTAEVILNYLWRFFMTEEQIMNSANASPSSITNFDIAEKGFIYTVTQSSEGQSSVRLLNFKGSNLEDENEFGDLEWDRKIKDSVSTAFCDVDADNEKYIFLLDSARGRVFVYSNDGYLISVFGGMGEKLGNFVSPVAIETNGDKVYVLDDQRSSITVFEANEYIKTVRSALNLLDQGKYTESREYWERVLDENSNSTIAYYGIGLALDEAGDYAEALKYFKLSYSNKAYSDAFKEVRREFIKEYFGVFIFAFLLVIVGSVFLIRFLKKKFGRKDAYSHSALEGRYTAPFFAMFHPIDGYEGLKNRRAWSLPLCGVILSLLFISLTAKWFLTGFSFNHVRASDYNVFITLLQAFVVVGVCAIANWAVCTLIEGKGRLIDIIGVLTYSLVPYIISILLNVVLSNVLTQEEGAFIAAIQLIGLLWSGALIFVGSMAVHQFSFTKNVLSVVLTVLGIAIIIFLAILFVGLLQQVVSFFRAIWSEAIMIK